MILSQFFVFLLIIFGCFWRLFLLRNLWWIHCVGGNSVKSSGIYFTLTKTMNKLISAKNTSLYHWYVHPRQKRQNFFTIGSKMEHFNQNVTKISFLSTPPANLFCYAKRDWKSWVCSRCKLWINRFVKKQRYKMHFSFWRIIWRDLHFKSICW